MFIYTPTCIHCIENFLNIYAIERRGMEGIGAGGQSQSYK